MGRKEEGIERRREERRKGMRDEMKKGEEDVKERGKGVKVEGERMCVGGIEGRRRTGRFGEGRRVKIKSRTKTTDGEWKEIGM